MSLWVTSIRKYILVMEKSEKKIKTYTKMKA